MLPHLIKAVVCVTQETLFVVMGLGGEKSSDIFAITLSTFSQYQNTTLTVMTKKKIFQTRSLGAHLGSDL